MEISRKLLSLPCILAVLGTMPVVRADQNTPVLKIPSQPILQPIPTKQEITAQFFYANPKVGGTLLRAKLQNKDGSYPPKGFKVTLSTGSYTCDTTVSTNTGDALCEVKIPFARTESNGQKFVNVGKVFTINATIPPEMGTLTVKETPTRKFTLLTNEGYAVHVYPEKAVQTIILPIINDVMLSGVLFNNFRGGKNPKLSNGSWIYLSKTDSSKAKSFDLPVISVTDKYGVNLVTGDFYVNRVFVKPGNVYLNDAAGTFNLNFSMTGFDGSGPSIVGYCRETFCPNFLVPDFKNLRFEQAQASYKLTVQNNQVKVSLVDSATVLKLDFDCSGGFKPFCGIFKDRLNAEVGNLFKTYLKDPLLLAQMEASITAFITKTIGTPTGIKVCSPNSVDCNKGEILVFHLPKPNT